MIGSAAIDQRRISCMVQVNGVLGIHIPLH